MKKFLLLWLLLICEPISLASGHDMHDISHDESYRVVNVHLPSLTMLRQDKREVSFPSEINDGRVTIVSFVYTTCQTICPITSQTFSKLQEKKVDVGGKPVHLVSISIDPEHDTVSKLARYAEKYKADANWNFYTGSSQASKDIQKAFGIYQGDKMNHAPVYFIKLNSTDDWLRIDGLVTADFLFSKIQEMR